MMKVGQARYGHPGSSSLRIDVSPPEEVDLKNYPFNSFDQRERAHRAIERFRGFTNGPANPVALRGLYDDFLVASEAIWHMKDHLGNDLDELAEDPIYSDTVSAGRAALAAARDAEPMQALRIVANASKHGKLRDSNAFPNTIVLTRKTNSYTEWAQLSDAYRWMHIELGGERVHVTDFLEGRLRDWSDVLEHAQKLIGKSMVDRGNLQP